MRADADEDEVCARPFQALVGCLLSLIDELTKKSYHGRILDSGRAHLVPLLLAGMNKKAFLAK
jgi:hypothetical protein